MNPKIMLFKEQPGFIGLFQLFKERYRSLGRMGGSVSLETFNHDELESISGFLGQSVDKLQNKKRLSLLDFEKELENTGLAEYTLLKLVEEVLGEKITTKKEESVFKQSQETIFIQKLELQLPHAVWWLKWILNKTADTRWFWIYYQQNKEELFEKVIVSYQAFTLLPKERGVERLPIFAQRITGNPHYFDHQELAEKLLLHLMYVDQNLKGNQDVVMPRNVEELNDLYAEYGIMRDDLWNFVTCQGLLATTNDTLHPVWQAAVSEKTVLNVPMKELTKIDQIYPAVGSKVWIVENSSVASMIMDAIPTAPIICTHGQLRMASWQLLDKLVQFNCTLYYSGDLDPEGVRIADKLLLRYKERIRLWRMDKDAYKKSLSDEDISSRLAKLNQISSPEWAQVIEEMKKMKKAGYQEAIVSSLIKDIENDGETS